MTPDLTGRRFGKLEIVGPAGPESGPLPPGGGWLVALGLCLRPGAGQPG
jgi:hypothetical protein